MDHLSVIMVLLVGFVALCVGSFSWRYLSGDRKKAYFYSHFIAMIFAVFVMVTADHILALLLAWGISQYLLTRLMRHKPEWTAANNASKLSLAYFSLAFLFLALGLAMLWLSTGQTSIQAIITSSSINSFILSFSAIFLVLAMMIQSSLWPFHRWLLSSLNSPTPVSAIMHAGLVNGGGFLCVRLSPMLAKDAIALHVLLIAGLISALLGTLWKLMQSDIKRMLACSTLGQMGFMLIQCGLGLFPAAVAHLCWHGLFKAYLFLSSGSAAQEKRLDLHYPPSLIAFFSASICGGLAAIVFTLASHAHLFLILMAYIAGTQFALPMIRMRQYLFALSLTPLIGFLYGKSVDMMESFLAPIHSAQTFDFDHGIAFFCLLATWLTMLFIRRPEKKGWPTWVLKAYVYLLNASQPSANTITSHRNHYQY